MLFPRVSFSRLRRLDDYESERYGRSALRSCQLGIREQPLLGSHGHGHNDHSLITRTTYCIYMECFTFYKAVLGGLAYF